MRPILEDIIAGTLNDTRAKIIRTALEEFASTTPGAVRMRTIAKKAGVNLALMNYHFGSKENLYMELAKMIVEQRKYATAEFFRRFKEIKKAPDAERAMGLIKDFFSDRINSETGENAYMRNIIVILMREEICNTEAFDIFLKELFVPRFKMMVELVEIASRGRLKGEDARIATRMLFGLTHLFNTARTGIKYDIKWKSFGPKQAQRARLVCSRILEKILK